MKIGTTSPLEVPVLKGQRQTIYAPGNEEKEETPAERSVRAEEAGVTRKEDGQLSQQPVKSQKADGGWKRTESALEISTVPTEAQEAHREVSSHASGEAWQTQRGAEETITVGITPNLGEDLILGTDYVNFTPLLEKACQEHITITWWEEALYGTAEVEARPVRKKLSRKKQKRKHRQEYRTTVTPESPEPVPRAATVLTTVGSFRQAQQEDPTLKNTWQQALHPDR
ncbi:hypothetical protein NDU88_004992 [Pleurodeles waltl]|uniref:Uncharacterized protein n=1 Tax=Pleurodeles waltl TaxID=8319 RepID=A0AAV7SKH5_PLEWA|nr:hypothetical protein NDU88_004992 [Pleurodeles waltl]